MTSSFDRTMRLLAKITGGRTPVELAESLAPKFDKAPPRIRYSSKHTAEAIEARWANIEISHEAKEMILDARSIDAAGSYTGNIENYIGTVKIPIGVGGPLRVNGLHAQGDFYVPLATTEGALVASFARGMDVITSAGGCSAGVLAEGVSRVPAFWFENVMESGLFVSWLTQNLDALQREAESTTSHGKLIDISFNIEGNTVYVAFSYETGDASGQNMVTIATDAACRYAMEHSPIKPRRWFIEANMSGDKKATAQSFQSVRGRKVMAEITVPRDMVKRKLHTSPEALTDGWRVGMLGGVMSGAIGSQAHFANGLTALFIATGQDVATVSEASVGITKMEITSKGDLYMSVTLPNLIVGTVGGGTGLPSQRASLELMGLVGTGKASAFAEVAAGVCLAGELSISAAVCAGQFTQAHKKLAR